MAKKTNFEVNGNKYFRVTKTIGHKSDGTPIRKTFYGTGINEANEKANEYMNSIKNGLNINFDNAILSEILKDWLFNIKRISIKPASFVSYECTYRLHILPSSFAGEKLCNIKKLHIQRYYNELFEKEKSNYKIKKINKLLHSFFEYCVEEGYLQKNPCHKIVIPKDTTIIHENKNIDIFSLEEINNIKKAFKRNKTRISSLYSNIYWYA